MGIIGCKVPKKLQEKEKNSRFFFFNASRMPFHSAKKRTFAQILYGSLEVQKFSLCSGVLTRLLYLNTRMSGMGVDYCLNS